VPRNRRGKFITIEGLDGCGKSTQLQRLANALHTEGFEVVVTREPGGTPIGEKIRAVLLDSGTSGLSPWAELALMFASRAQQIDEVIQPALAAGKWVLCDRFTDSSEAYQGGGRRLGSGPVLDLHRVLCRELQPDMTILMDSDVAASVARARRRNLERIRRVADSGVAEADENRFEQESRAFFERVRDKYLEIARREPQRVFVVDARRQAEVVFPEILAEVRKRTGLGDKQQATSS
jgi:dTMP kinase